MRDKVSVIVCARNEEQRLGRALDGIRLNDPDEVIIVDDDSTDSTVAIAKRYTSNVILSKTGSLTQNRQIGIDRARNDLIAMIDADHILVPGDIDSLVADLRKYDFDMVTGQLMSYANASVWNAAEEDSWDLTHNFAGPMAMIPVAPTIFKKSLFKRVRFDGHITVKMDDTDFLYRLGQLEGVRFGVGDTKIRQLHAPDLRSYLRKFRWYGYGDGEFVRKHPERTGAILFHQLVRYPFIYSGTAIFRGRSRAVPFFVLQGGLRFIGLMSYGVQWSMGKIAQPVPRKTAEP